MTEEEIKKKADKYHLDNVTSEEVFYHSGTSEKVRKAFIDGAKSRDSEIEQERNYAFEYLKPLIDGQKKEIEELKEKLEHRNCVDCSNHGANIELIKLKAQIEKMKCCYNCKYRCFEKCIDCQRGFYDGKNDHWELAE